MIVTQHMPGCRALLVGLPCGCSRTELPDPPTHRKPATVTHYHPHHDYVCWGGSPCQWPIGSLFVTGSPNPETQVPSPDPGCPVCFGQGYKHCGLATHEGGRGCGQRCEFCRPREQWRLTGEVYDMDDGERVYVYQKDGPGFILTTGLSTVHFSRRTT